MIQTPKNILTYHLVNAQYLKESFRPVGTQIFGQMTKGIVRYIKYCTKVSVYCNTLIPYEACQEFKSN